MIMTQYIPKYAIVEEIERLRKNQRLDDRHGQGVLDGLHAIERYLDTTEVKEADLEKEVNDYFVSMKVQENENIFESTFRLIAKHFFELGMQAQSNNQSSEHVEPHNTVEQTTSLWERLKLCYRALTRDYYIFFACDKDAIQFNEDGKYETIDRRKTAAFTYVGDEPMMIAYGKVTTFHDFYWHIIEEFSKKAQQGEF